MQDVVRAVVGDGEAVQRDLVRAGFLDRLGGGLGVEVALVAVGPDVEGDVGLGVAVELVVVVEDVDETDLDIGGDRAGLVLGRLAGRIDAVADDAGQGVRAGQDGRDADLQRAGGVAGHAVASLIPALMA